MNRDWMFGIGMAGAVALYPNLIAAALFLNGLNDLGSKCWLVFFFTVGPALLGSVLFGVRTKRPRDFAPQPLSRCGKLLFDLAISGLFATAYLLAIVGLGDDQQGKAKLGWDRARRVVAAVVTTAVIRSRAECNQFIKSLSDN